MKKDEILKIAQENNIDLIDEYVKDNHFGLIYWFNINPLDIINCSVKEGSKSKVDKMLNEKADSILTLFLGFTCICIEFEDRVLPANDFSNFNEAYYFEFIKKDKKWKEN